MTTFNRSYEGDIFALLHWAYGSEFAHRTGGFDNAASVNSGTAAIGRMMSLGTIVDASSVGAISVANDSHADAELAHDLVTGCVSGQTLGLIINHAVHGHKPVLPPIPVVRASLGETETDPNKGTVQGWPHTYAKKVNGVSRMHGVRSVSQRINLSEHPAAALRGALTLKAWWHSMKLIEEHAMEHRRKLTRWKLNGWLKHDDADHIEARIDALRSMIG